MTIMSIQMNTTVGYFCYKSHYTTDKVCEGKSFEEIPNLIKELLCPSEDVLKLRQFQEVLLQGFLVGVDLPHLIL